MFLAPSCINYIYSEHYSNISSETMDKSIIDLVDQISFKEEFPKIQAVEKDGKWFTLNNSQLELCRRLEMDGKCSKVKVEILPLSGVPHVIRRMMVVPPKTEAPDTSKDDGSRDLSRSTGRGYQKLGQADGPESRLSEDHSDTSSTDTDTDDSDSECDWSIDEKDSSDCDTTSSDDDDDDDDDDGERQGSSTDASDTEHDSLL